MVSMSDTATSAPAFCQRQGDAPPNPSCSTRHQGYFFHPVVTYVFLSPSALENRPGADTRPSFQTDVSPRAGLSGLQDKGQRSGHQSAIHHRAVPLEITVAGSRQAPAGAIHVTRSQYGRCCPPTRAVRPAWGSEWSCLMAGHGMTGSSITSQSWKNSSQRLRICIRRSL